MKNITKRITLSYALKSIVISALLFSALISFSQDVIFLSDKSELEVKVIEITDQTVIYRNFNQPDGPLKNVSKSDVFLIIYQDGTREAFAEESYLDPASDRANFGEGLVADDTPATVYFTRISGFGFAVSFEFFHNDKYIGVFKGKNYMEYQCPPGTHLFWASSENKEFITAELKPGGKYIVIVDVIMGGWKARVGLNPINENGGELYLRAKELIMKKEPVVTSKKTIDKRNAKLDKFIDDKLEKYESEWKDTQNFKHISPDLAITDPDFK